MQAKRSVAGADESCATIVNVFRRLLHDHTGSPSIEFAILFPLFLLMIFGVMEFGRVLFTYGLLTFAAEEATRYATVDYDASVAEIRNVAEDKLQLIDASNITGFDVRSVINADQTRLVTVEIDYDFAPMVPIGWTTIPLTGHSRGFLVDE